MGFDSLWKLPCQGVWSCFLGVGPALGCWACWLARWPWPAGWGSAGVRWRGCRGCRRFHRGCRGSGPPRGAGRGARRRCSRPSGGWRPRAQLVADRDRPVRLRAPPPPHPRRQQAARRSPSIVRHGIVTGDPLIAQLRLILQLAALAEAVTGLRTAQRHAAQAVAAKAAAERLYAAGAPTRCRLPAAPRPAGRSETFLSPYSKCWRTRQRRHTR